MACIAWRSFSMHMDCFCEACDIAFRCSTSSLLVKVSCVRDGLSHDCGNRSMILAADEQVVRSEWQVACGHSTVCTVTYLICTQPWCLHTLEVIDDCCGSIPWQQHVVHHAKIEFPPISCALLCVRACMTMVC